MAAICKVLARTSSFSTSRETRTQSCTQYDAIVPLDSGVPSRNLAKISCGGRSCFVSLR